MTIPSRTRAPEPKALSPSDKPRVLLVEDDFDIRDLIRFNLEREGFEIETATDGDRGLELALSRIYDVILLDLMLPGTEGTEICRRLRKDARTATVPVIMVTSRGEERDIVDGLNLGADDYVTKPFSMRELVARVRTAARRHRDAPGETQTKPMHRGGIELDPVRHEVRVQGEPVVLTLTEFRLLHHLMKHPGRVFSRTDLLPHAVGQGVVVVDRNIDVHVRNLRKKLGDDAAASIATVRGLGYKFDN